MQASGTRFTVLYRWRLKAGTEQIFAEAWSKVTRLLKQNRGAVGSRLHRGSDGIWYAYAPWPTAMESVDAEASQPIRRAIDAALPEIVLEIIEDEL